MKPRIAVIGNMNNNSFALMRYLRDLGLDAYLLLYTNELEHFLPECDTWEWEKWRPYVRRLGVSNGGTDAILARPAALRRRLSEYDVCIGNGIAPVLFQRMGRQLDMFIPYGDGVEFIVEHHFTWRRLRSSLARGLRKKLMERGLKKAVKVIVSANQHPHSQGTYRRLGLTPLSLPIPMLYLEAAPKGTEVLPPAVRVVLERMRSSELVVFSHVAHIWKNLPVPQYMGGFGKRNNWLVEGFSQFLATSPDRDALLCLVEYGPDVAETKQLIAELGVEEHVVWLPQMQRRELMLVLRHVDIGGSEFAEMYWGGCGWEFLASGVPMLHQLRDLDRYESDELPLPPFFNVESPADIAEVLRSHDRASLREMGSRCRQWFQRFQGAELAGKYAEILRS
jgi:glycosyltransferase involved in cell wall biosynthesis